jgi:ribosomal-protein-alanine N-acetyltransferase
LNIADSESACPVSEAVLLPITEADLEAVLIVEREIYPFPWTRGNFMDSLASQYDCMMLIAGSTILAYSVTMPSPDEVHLLNLSVRSPMQGKGVGGWLLRTLMRKASLAGYASMLLEVRVSNTGAQRLYSGLGFAAIGRRRRYYPSFNNTREDAIVMRRVFDAQ